MSAAEAAGMTEQEYRDSIPHELVVVEAWYCSIDTALEGVTEDDMVNVILAAGPSALAAKAAT